MAIILASDIFNPRCLTDTIMLPFTVISIPVYAIFFCALIKYRNAELSGSFFTLHISIAIGDLLNLLFGKFFYKFPVFCGLFPFGYDIAMQYPHFFGKLVAFMFWYTMHVQMCGAVTITINRFTAVVFPLRHNKIWSKRFLWLMISGMWLLPLAFSVAVLTTDVSLIAKFNSQRELRWYQFDYDNEWIETIIFGVSGIWIGIVLNVTLFIMYLTMFVSFVKNRATLAASNVSAKTKAYTEVKLAFCGFIFFLVLSAFGIILLRMVFENIFDYYCAACIYMYSVVGDVTAWVNPYVLLVMSSQTRQCFLNIIGLGRWCGNGSGKTRVVQLTQSVGGVIIESRSKRTAIEHSGHI